MSKEKPEIITFLTRGIIASTASTRVLLLRGALEHDALIRHFQHAIAYEAGTMPEPLAGQSIRNRRVIGNLHDIDIKPISDLKPVCKVCKSGNWKAPKRNHAHGCWRR